MKLQKNTLLENVKIDEIVAEGKCISKLDEVVIFSAFTAPGDVVDLEIIKKKRRYFEGKVVNFHQKSSVRTSPKCQYFGTCGGCKWQHVNYTAQLEAKQKQVKDAFERIGHLKDFEMLPILGSEKIYNYRNKLEFTFSDTRWLTKEEMNSGNELDRRGLGFHIPGLFDKIIDIEECYLQSNISNEIRNFTRDFSKENDIPFFNIRNQTGQLRNLIIRTSETADLMVIVQFFYEDENCEKILDVLKENFPEITSLMYVINSKGNETFHDLEVKCFSGNPYIIEQMEDVKFKIGPKTFYQTNSKQAKSLYNVALEMAQISENDLVYDLYTGAGTIANYTAKKAKKVVGIEYVESAIEDAKENSKLNKISNTSFFAGDMKDVLNDDFIVQNGKPDIIITDPPRTGMHPEVVSKILDIEAQKIVYVSCNPATQARDLEMLSVKYKLLKINPVDMFPHTHHVESVALMELK